MCGICGKKYLSSDLKVSKQEIITMRDTMISRGPNEAGIYLNKDVGLGHRRLSIIDIESSKQPISNEDETIWIVFNGEIYNFNDLRNELLERGHIFRTTGDTEVIVHLYEEYGEDCVNELRGMFAFAIWDERKRVLFLARDRAGIKPLYYFCDEKIFLFGSELKAILADKDYIKRKTIDVASVFHYFDFLYVPEPKTIFKGIKKLPRGHTLFLRDGNPELKKYWDVSFSHVPRDGGGEDEEGCCEKLLDLLTESVRIRLIAEVPLGAFLSGGIDSSAVVAIMSQLSSKPVKTFSIGFTNEKYNEASDARIVADYFGTDHTELLLDPRDIVMSIPEILLHFDEPFADSSAIPTFYVSKLAREKVTVVLSGDGGDELFGGYPWWQRRPAYQLALDKLPRGMKKAVGQLAQLLPHYIPGANYLRHIDIPYQRYLLNTKAVFNEPDKNKLFSRNLIEEFGKIDSYRYNIDYLAKEPGQDWASKIMEYDFKTYLTNDILQKVDRMSMFHSIEARVPILDHKLVEFSATIPSSLKIKSGISKYIFKKTMAGILPHTILNKKKQGFSIPLETWLRSDLKEMVMSVVLDRNSHNFFSKDYISGIMKDFHNEIDMHNFKIWEIFSFNLWYRNHFG